MLAATDSQSAVYSRQPNHAQQSQEGPSTNPHPPDHSEQLQQWRYALPWRRDLSNAIRYQRTKIAAYMHHPKQLAAPPSRDQTNGLHARHLELIEHVVERLADLAGIARPLIASVADPDARVLGGTDLAVVDAQHAVVVVADALPLAGEVVVGVDVLACRGRVGFGFAPRRVRAWDRRHAGVEHGRPQVGDVPELAVVARKC